ncbi:MAG TPA: ATP-binding protein [Thermoanaerobaculia bacterium]|nr:ATP-binding protein [Thermoanaerobaculia bacterium]
MFRSIRWNLLGWYSALLLAALSGFGSVLYHRLQALTDERIETELAGAAELIQERIHVHRPHHPGQPAVTIPESLLQRFGSSEDEAAYAVLWLPDGARFASAQAPPDVPRPKTLRREQPDVPRFRQRGDLREVILARHNGGHLVVGRSTAVEASQLRRLTWELVGTGLAVLLFGLGGAWLLLGRSLQPIADMSATAEAVSASNLSRRIDVAETQSELGPLARVLNRMLDRLEGAFEQQKRFTADASHELRTPLAVVLSQTELALAREREPAEYVQALETCARAAQRMRSLVNDLLVLARADAGVLELEPQPFDLKSCIEECVTLVQPLAAERGLPIGLDLSEGADVEWTGDLERTAQVITNLLTNAIRYNRPGGRVDVHLEAHPSEIVLTVADTGIGIPEDERARIFERFHRVDKVRSREMGGSGLGLAICKSLLAAQGGTIECTSTLGEGSTFTVRLPGR